MCTGVVKEVIDDYVSNGSNVFACALGAFKAFDRVDHVKLFQLLLKRDLPGVVVRFLFDSYQRQQVYVNWNNTLSAPILMKNWVKQGGVLSPVMFCVFFGELIYRLRNTGMGCYIGHINNGQSGYADDVQMLSPSVTGLQKMVNLSEEFGREYDVSFNAKKTVGMCFGDQMLFKQLRHIVLNGAKISWDTSAKHLGNMLSTPQNDACDINVNMG